jgi:hypothetical protein
MKRSKTLTKRSKTLRKAQKRQEKVRDGQERSGTVNGQERSSRNTVTLRNDYSLAKALLR